MFRNESEREFKNRANTADPSGQQVPLHLSFPPQTKESHIEFIKAPFTRATRHRGDSDNISDSTFLETKRISEKKHVAFIHSKMKTSNEKNMLPSYI